MFCQLQLLFVITGIKLAWHVISGDVVSARKEREMRKYIHHSRTKHIIPYLLSDLAVL